MALAADERMLLQESLERLARAHYTLASRRALLTGNVGFNRESWQRLAELGIFALPFDIDLGGLSGSLADVMVIGRVLGEALSLDPYIPCVILCGGLLARMARRRFADNKRRLDQLALLPLLAAAVLVGYAVLKP